MWNAFLSILICEIRNSLLDTPTIQLINHLDVLSICLDQDISLHDDILLFADFNSELGETALKEFFEIYNLKNLVKEATCFRNPVNPTCIALILTNRPRSFQDTKAIEMGLSNYHKMTVAVLKTYFKKEPPVVIPYRDYKHYFHDHFQVEVNYMISS